MKTAFLLILSLHLFLPQALTQASVTINVAHRLKTLNGIENGINLNYLMDGGITNPSTTTSAALKNMGVTLLRYPGGEKSDNYLWSAAPWKAASPRMALLDTAHAWPTEDSRFVDQTSAEKLCNPSVLDFDELMTMCQATGAQPLIVVAYDAMYNTLVATKPTKAQLITNAVEWVRYANITKKFGIKYWMIGNESWNQPDYNGRTTPAQYAIDLADFAKAMKAVDPTIKIIANGQNSWWPTLLKSPAVSYIDILGFSLYPVYKYTKGYETYRAGNKSLTSEIEDAIKAINTYAPAADKKRLKVLASEYNSIDFSNGWNNDNTLGHALCNFQMFGDMVNNPKVESACMWNTRWTDNQTADQHIYDALNKDGGLNAIGTAQQVWGKNLLNTMVAAGSGDTKIKVYASYDTVTKALHVFLLNKDTAAKGVTLSVDGYTTAYSGSRFVFSGVSVNDKFPVFSPAGTLPVAAGDRSVLLAPASVTVLKLVPAQFQLYVFAATRLPKGVALDWKTENDFDLDYYAIEKKDGISNSFDSIGRAVAKSYENPLASYRFIDTATATLSAVQYRLKLVARNHATRYSDTLTVQHTVADNPQADPLEFQCRITPNPVYSRLKLQTHSPVAQQATLRITDAAGRVWGFEKVLLPAGKNTYTLNLANALQRGIYLLQIGTATEQKTLKFLKM